MSRDPPVGGDAQRSAAGQKNSVDESLAATATFKAAPSNEGVGQGGEGPPQDAVSEQLWREEIEAVRRDPPVGGDALPRTKKLLAYLDRVSRNGELACREADAASLIRFQDEEIRALRHDNSRLYTSLTGEANARIDAEAKVESQAATIATLQRQLADLDVPEIRNFMVAVDREAKHQIKRWGYAHDRSKSAENWFWLVGYLAGKALRSAITGDRDKALHHTISSAAALANWHAAIIGDTTGSGIGQDDDLRKTNPIDAQSADAAALADEEPPA